MNTDDDLPELEEETTTIGNNNVVVGKFTNNAADSDSNVDDDDDDNENEEEEEGGEPTKCLFCDKHSPAIETAIEHLDKAHNIKLTELKKKFQMDQYSYIKLINCVRRETVSAAQLAEAKQAFWTDEKYLKPIEYEPWLSYDFEALPIDNELTETVEATKQLDAYELVEKVKLQANMLKQANDDMEKMRKGFALFMQQSESEMADITKDDSVEAELGVGANPVDSDIGYFSSYGHFGIHHEMLSDVVRTTSYRDALLKNKSYIEGKTVLDVGCGTSVLSIFASQAGASKVIGVDNSDIIYNALDIVRLNNIKNVELIKGRLEDAELPLDKYDIIISEWMGYFLLFECMLDSIIHARNKYLKPTGKILPNHCTLNLLGYGSDALYKEHIDFWNDVYGLKMSNMIDKVLHEPLIDIVDPEHILTESEIIADLNIETVDLNYTNFSHQFNMKCTKDGTLSAFVGYFDTFFDLPTPIMFGTAPTDKPTHWKQVVFFLAKPQQVKAGEVIQGKIICSRLYSGSRSLDIEIEVFGKQNTYYLD